MFSPDLRDTTQYGNIPMVCALTLLENGDMSHCQIPRGIKSIYTLLKCDAIEAIRLPPDAVMYIDEEGKFKPEAKINRIASILGWLVGGLSPHDCIVGNAIIFGTVSPSGENDGEDYSTPTWINDFFINFALSSKDDIESFTSFLHKGLIEYYKGKNKTKAKAGTKKRK